MKSKDKNPQTLVRKNTLIWTLLWIVPVLILELSSPPIILRYSLILSLFPSTFYILAHLATGFKLRLFKKEGNSHQLSVIKNPQEHGAKITKPKTQEVCFSYSFLKPLLASDLLPPSTNIGDLFTEPTGVLDRDKAVFGSDKMGVTVCTMPYIRATWPDNYKTPYQVKKAKAERDFENGENMKWVLTEGKQGTPPKLLT